MNKTLPFGRAAVAAGALAAIGLGAAAPAHATTLPAVRVISDCKQEASGPDYPEAHFENGFLATWTGQTEVTKAGDPFAGTISFSPVKVPQFDGRHTPILRITDPDVRIRVPNSTIDSVVVFGGSAHDDDLDVAHYGDEIWVRIRASFTPGEYYTMPTIGLRAHGPATAGTSVAISVATANGHAPVNLPLDTRPLVSGPAEHYDYAQCTPAAGTPPIAQIANGPFIGGHPG